MGGMTPRQRMQAILNKEVPDRMGLFEHFWPETLEKNWVVQGYPQGVDPIDHFNYDLRPAPWSMNARLRAVDDEVVEESEEWRITKDGNGAILKLWKDKSGTPEHIGFTIDTPKKWEEAKGDLLVLDPERVNLDEQREFAAKAKSEDRFHTFGTCAHFELMRAILGDVVMLESLLLEPDWIQDFCETYTDFFIRHYTLLFDEVGHPDGMFIYEDLGFSNGPFCSPKTYREVIYPHHKKLFDFFKDRGLPIILHTCGDVRELVPDLIEVGVDCLQPMEAKAGNDLFEFAEKYPGKLGYMGNIDVTVLNTNDTENIRTYLTETIQKVRALGIPYVFHSDHSIPPDVDLSTYRMALEILETEGVYAG